MSEPRNDGEPTRKVTRSEFQNDASATLRRAEREGPVVVTDERGAALMTVYSPREELPFRVD